MMMFRKARWIYVYAAVLFFCFLFFIIDIKKEVFHIYKKSIEEKNLSNTAEAHRETLIRTLQDQKKSVLQVDNTLLDTSSMLAYLAHFFAAQNVTVGKMQLLKIKTVSGVNMLPVKINAAGQFSTFIKLIFALTQGDRPIVINDFSFERDKNGKITAEIQLFIVGVNAKSLKMDYQAYQTMSVAMLADSVSLRKMRWGGFLQHEQSSSGLLILPDGRAIEVQLGAIIGMEKGKVIEVKEDEININVAGKIVKIAPIHS